MTQTVAATCVLGPSLTGLAIGVTVLNVDGTEYAAFSTTGVAETSVAGTYRKAGGVVCPDAGGYLVWGVSGTDYAEATVDPKPAQAGDEMDLVDAPNATAVAAIATKTLRTLIIPNLVSGSLAEYVYDTKIASGYGYIINNAIGAWTGSGVNTVLGAFKALLSKTASAPSDIGGTFDPATDSTEAISEAVAGVGTGGLTAQETADAVYNLAPTGSPATNSAGDLLERILVDTGTTLPGLIGNLGTGARTVLVTVDDGTDPLEAARVRLTQGVETYVGSTNINGQVTFNVDDATWTVAITKAGYTYAGTTLTVDGDKTPTYSMTAVSFSASAPGQSTGWVYCYDENGDAEADVTVNIQQTATPETDSYAFDTVIRAGTSDENGLVEFTGLWIGATYQVRRYSGSWHSVTIPNSSSFALPALLGK